jgi:hypothetical protein
MFIMFLGEPAFYTQVEEYTVVLMLQSSLGCDLLDSA